MAVLAPVVRVERTSSGLEAEALPLDDTGKLEERTGIEPVHGCFADNCGPISPTLSNAVNAVNAVDAVDAVDALAALRGVEPTVSRFRGERPAVGRKGRGRKDWDRTNDARLFRPPLYC